METPVPPNPDELFSLSDSHYTDYGIQDLDWFEPSLVTDKRRVHYTSRKQVWECQTEKGEVFLIEPRKIHDHNIPPETSFVFRDEQNDGGDEYGDNSDSGSDIVDKSRKAGYEISRKLGVPGPVHRFTENWIAVLGGPSDLEAVSGREEVEPTKWVFGRDGFNLDRFVNDMAKVLLLSHHDPSTQNILVDPTSLKYTFIDVHCKKHRYYLTFRGHRMALQVFETLLQKHIADLVLMVCSARAVGIGKWVLSNKSAVNVPGEFENLVWENIEKNVEILPMGPSTLTGILKVGGYESRSVSGLCEKGLWDDVIDIFPSLKERRI